MTSEEPETIAYADVDAPQGETFYELLDMIRQRPAMFIGSASLRSLDTWLSGFLYARESAGLPPLPGIDDFAGFDRFVQDRYDWHDTGGWVAKIEYLHHHADRALAEFFTLLDDYRGRTAPAE